jgi:hypothetical protein
LSPEHWHYIERCGAALDRLNGCVDWDALTVMRSDSKGTPVSIVDSWIVPAFCGFCGGLWLTLIISQPSLWWVPLMLMAPIITWRAWDSWCETKSLLTPSEYRDWVLGVGPRKTSRRNRFHAWWMHFTGARFRPW